MHRPQRSVGLLLLLLCTLVVCSIPANSELPTGNATGPLDLVNNGPRNRHSRHQHRTRIVITGEVATADVIATAPQVVSNVSAAAQGGEPDSPSETKAPDNTTATIAQVLDKALIREFEQDTKDAESEKGKTFNETVANEEGTVETVVRISGSGNIEGSSDSSTGSSSGSAADGSNADADSSDSSGSTPATQLPEIELGVDRIIDSQDNEFVLSARKDNVATLTLDPLLIQDLTFLFASAAVLGVVFESIKQPVINGYLVAGAIVGPGGLQLIKELVQVESLAQLGVQLLLFHLGRELSFKKLRSVWSVALLGGSLQIVALMALGGLVAAAFNTNVMQGVFLGALLSMSSTSVVVKCLEAYRMTASAYGQITIGTLILQDCSVGLMFALMPAFGAAAAASNSSPGGNSSTAGTGAVDPGTAEATANSVRDAALLGVAVLLAKVTVKLVLVLAGALAAARTVLPVLLRLLLRYASKELVQLSLVSLCLTSAWLCGQLGLSEELGAFIAGAMMSVAERKLVAAGLLLPNHGLSQPPSPRSSSVMLHHHDHDSKHSSPRAGAPVGAFHAVAADVLRTQGSGFTAETLPLRALQPHGHAAKEDGFPIATAAADASEPAISVCANIESIQNVLTALFVASMGLIMSPVFLWHHALVLLLGTLVVTLVKAAVVTAVIRLFGVPLKLGLAVGLSMAHIGEFSLVLLSMANQLKLLSSQVYMLLLGVTAMSLLTTPFVILAAVHLLIKEGHHQLYISGPRLRLSSAAGDKPQTTGDADWAIVMNDGQPLHATSKAAVARSNRDGARISGSAGVRPVSASHRERDASPYGDGSGTSTHKRQQRPG